MAHGFNGTRDWRWGGTSGAGRAATRVIEPLPPRDPRDVLANRAEWQAWAAEVVAAEDEWMLLDVETTGDRDCDIIEFSAVSPSGRTLVDQLIRPRKAIPPYITQLTGIAPAMVADAPTWAFAYPQLLAEHLGRRRVLVYNVSYDVPVIRKNIARHCRRDWNPVESACLMRAYQKYRGERFPAGHASAGRVRPHSLENACRQMGVAYGHGHRALHDCQVSAALLQAMARGEPGAPLPE